MWCKQADAESTVSTMNKQGTNILFTYPFSLVAEAEGADGSWLFASGFSLRAANGAQTRLCVLAAVPNKQHVGQVGDVAGRKAQGLDLGELPVYRLRGYKSP